MSAQLMTKWYGIHKLQETMAGLQLELARLSADPSDRKPQRNLVQRVEFKLADLMAALQWFEYHNKLDVDPDRIEHTCETYDAYHNKPLLRAVGQTHMQGIVCLSDEQLLNIVRTNPEEPPRLVLTLSDDEEPETQPSSSVASREQANGRG